MLKRICFILRPDSAARAGEAGRAVREFTQMGLSGEIRCGEPAVKEGTLCLCEDGETLRELRDRGFCVAGYTHAGNADARFDGASYVVQEPDLVDVDSYEKIYQREAGLPWKILETPRCLVREFVEEDLESLYGLYDREACRFLEPPSPDRERERAILRAYIDRIYGLYGFGHWAVLLKGEAKYGPPGASASRASAGRASAKRAPENWASVGRASAGRASANRASGEKTCPGGEAGQASAPVLAGRIGFAALTAGQEEEIRCLGIPDRPDADFGFLIGKKWRGTGLAGEVCEALLHYGFSRLGFACVRADAHRDNIASHRLLERLGFSPAGEGGEGRRIYIRYA